MTIILDGTTLRFVKEENKSHKPTGYATREEAMAALELEMARLLFEMPAGVPVDVRTPTGIFAPDWLERATRPARAGTPSTLPDTKRPLN